ncbi:MAG: phage Gp37/Gp68 family protein [Sphingomonadales bacterium]
MTKIEWTEQSWNPIVGCSVISPGCTNCYAMRCAGTRLKHTDAYKGLTKPSKSGPVWTGEMRLNEKALLTPLKRKKPTLYFVNSMGDLFHENAHYQWIDSVFAVMALCPQHTFQVLTKRAERMRRYMFSSQSMNCVGEAMQRLGPKPAASISTVMRQCGAAVGPRARWWPLPNVWLGVSAEDQARANERIPLLLDTPAAVRFVSCEPLLGPIDLQTLERGAPRGSCSALPCEDGGTYLDWVIVGGESGGGARPMYPDWARQIRDDCARHHVPFFFKQWGDWAPGECCPPPTGTSVGASYFAEKWVYEEVSLRTSEALHVDDEPDVWRVGKRRALKMLDGQSHAQMPEVG